MDYQMNLALFIIYLSMIKEESLVIDDVFVLNFFDYIGELDTSELLSLFAEGSIVDDEITYRLNVDSFKNISRKIQYLQDKEHFVDYSNKIGDTTGILWEYALDFVDYQNEIMAMPCGGYIQ